MDPRILYTIAQKESGMNPNVSPNENGNGTKDYGMMQINTGDAQDNGWDINRLQSDLGYNVEAAAKTLVEKAQMLKRMGEPVNLFNLFKAYNGWSDQGAQYAQDAVRIYNQM